MNTSKLGPGETIAGISALALFIFLFLPWYGVEASFGDLSASTDVTAWEAFSFIDILLFLAVLAVLGVILAVAAGSPPDSPGTIIAIAGGAALILVLFRLIFVPDGDVDVEGIDVGREFGVFLALIASAGMAYGGWRAMDAEPSVPSAPVAPAASPPPPPPPSEPAATQQPPAPAPPAQTPPPAASDAPSTPDSPSDPPPPGGGETQQY